MNRIPVGVGNPAAQQRFIKAHKEFLLEYPALHLLLEKVSLRNIEGPAPEEVDQLRKLPEDDPRVAEFEDRMMADGVVFGLGRIIADDFGELLMLSGNGRGIGAYKILRGLYERLVTAAYIAKNPSEARPFVEDGAIKRWKLWREALDGTPDLKESIPKETIEALESEYRRVKAKNSESVCKKCGHPKTREAWTRVDLATMAKLTEPKLSGLYGACYLLPTFHSHATSFSVDRRFVRKAGVVSYQETSEGEARLALMLSHNLMIAHLTVQNDYFRLGLTQEIGERIRAFLRIWETPAEGVRQER